MSKLTLAPRNTDYTNACYFNIEDENFKKVGELTFFKKSGKFRLVWRGGNQTYTAKELIELFEQLEGAVK